MVEIPQSNQLETATFAGGCFWCTEAIFKRLEGVSSVVSGYTGGKTENPSYQEVITGRTGHVEAIQISFDQKVISYNKLLKIFWEFHDPTTLNRQGPDVGAQYKSAIFYDNQDQKVKAEISKERLEKSGKYRHKIVTEILPLTNFYKAEDSHQNYYDTYKNFNPYCTFIIDPKIKKLIELFNSEVKEEYK